MKVEMSEDETVELKVAMKVMLRVDLMDAMKVDEWVA